MWQLLIIVVTGVVLYFFGQYVGSLLNTGNWLTFLLLFPAIFVFGYFVGDDADKADYWKIRDWFVSFFR